MCACAGGRGCACAVVGRREKGKAVEGGMNQTREKKQFVFSLSSDNNAT